jgi:hypothetical protein
MQRRWWGRPCGLAAVLTVTALAAAGCGSAEHASSGGDRDRGRDANVKKDLAFNKGEADRGEGKGEKDGGEDERTTGPAQQQVDQRAYPRLYVDDKLALAGRKSYVGKPVARATGRAASLRGDEGDPALATPWTELGPKTPTVDARNTYTGRETTNSGRATALAISPTCDSGGTASGACRLWLAAAGGGVWRTDDALAAKPTWSPVDSGLTTDAIGSLVVDPNDASGNTLYAGTGEPNGSSDSEAGLGLFKSTDGGDHWSLVPGSFSVAHDRAIASVAIDPTDPDHLAIATGLARHGSSSSNGGRRTPPDAPTLGIYESTDGGSHFNLVFTKAGDPNDPATGNDLFIGSANKVAFDSQYDGTTHDALYAAVQGYGIWRRSETLDGDRDFHQVFQTYFPADESATEGGSGERTEFALTVATGKTRIYAGDSSDDFPDDHPYTKSGLWRLDDADRPASALVGGTPRRNITTAGNWVDLSTGGSTDPDDTVINDINKFSSQNYCQQQCSYDDPVAVAPDNPDKVVLGGMMRYNELPGIPQLEPRRSNGRAVILSTDKGVSFTDMTDDARTPAEGLHPDNHALAFDPHNTNVIFIASDGGLMRTSGSFADRSADCASRKDTHGDPLALNDLAFCQLELSRIPTQLNSLNDGLATLQFQSLSFNPKNPTGDLLGGTQDNGTWAFTGSPNWTEVIGGDGGQSAVDSGGVTRVHSYFGPTLDVNFKGNDPSSWYLMSEPMYDMFNNGDESFSFYTPLALDQHNSGTLFTGGEHVWRTKDWGGLANKADRDQHCLQTAVAIGDGDYASCGDWEPLGAKVAPNPGNYVVATELAPADSNTLWVGLRRGGVFVTKNAAAAADSVTFTRADDPADTATAEHRQPTRFVSSIHVDPVDPNHAWVSYSGYSAYTPKTPGHVFEATFHPGDGKTEFKSLDYDIGDVPITDLVRDDATGDLYASTDYGVLRLASGGTHWQKAAAGLPVVATYGLTIDAGTRTLYAATHGRGVWKATLGPVPSPPSGGTGTTPAPTPVPGKPAAHPKVGRPKVSVRRTHGKRRFTITIAVQDLRTLRVRLSDQKGRSLTVRTLHPRSTARTVKLVITVSTRRRHITRRTKWKIGVVGTGTNGRQLSSKALVRP